MPKGQALDSSILEAALAGLQAQRQRIEEMIAQVKRMAGDHRGRAAAKPVAATRRRRKMSAAGRRRIVAALKKRWAEYHKQKAARQAPAA